MYLVATIGIMAFRILTKSVYEVLFTTDKGIRTFIYGVKDGGVGLAKALEVMFHVSSY